MAFLPQACRTSSDGPCPMTDTPPKLRYLALGDSYTIGEGVAAAERWPVQLAAKLGELCIPIGEPEIVARTGWTTDELDRAIDAANPRGTFDLVTLLIGVNNQYRGRDPEEYRAQLISLLGRAVRFSGGHAERVVVLSIPDWGVTPFAKGRDSVKISKEIALFNAIGRDEAARAGARWVDITPISAGARDDSSLLVSDGLHPSGTMYALWAREALPAARGALGR